MIDLTRHARTATRDPRWDRALARAPRIVALTLALVLMAAGLRAILAPTPRATAAPPPAAPTLDLAAQGFATELASLLLAYRPATADQRAADLAALVGEGWRDAGVEPPEGVTQRVLSARAVQDQAAIAGGRLITVAVRTDRSGLVHLSVPMARDGDGRLRLNGYPAFVGAPATAHAAGPPSRRAVRDDALARVARRAVANYLARDEEDLLADLAPGARVALPALALTVEGRADVAEAGPGGVLVTVHARDADGGRYTLTYELGVTFAGRWSVSAIQTFPHQP